MSDKNILFHDSLFLFSKISILFLLIIFNFTNSLAQNFNTNNFIDNYIRNYQLNSGNVLNSFLLRPIYNKNPKLPIFFMGDSLLGIEKSPTSFKLDFKMLPVSTGVQIGTNNPYPEVSKFIQAKGYQQWLSGGFISTFGPFSLTLQPEFFFADNKYYSPGVSKGGGMIEYVEIYGNRNFVKRLPGQSSLRLNYGGFSLGASTENIWWGPGQYNSLLFSNNAFGFQHLTLNTYKPAKTFFGSFEGQLIIGKLENFVPFIREGKEDWRYVNGITFSYQPKWLPGFFIGASRVFQQYSSFNDKSWSYYFPLFEPFQKVRLIDLNSPNFDSSVYDGRLQSQQLTGFSRLVIPKAKVELYFEYGRRDHAVDWREFLLNPEHARAYIIGFKKLISFSNEAIFQINGEILQQQESINILNRYGKSGGQSWASHGILQGFTHQGQLLGPGIGPSSNVQILETSWVKGVKKLGIRWERLNRHQDVYTVLFNDPSENGRWIDYSARLLADWKFDNLLVSTTTNFVYSLNNQWNLSETSTSAFPKGKNSFMVVGQLNFIYFLGKNFKKKDLLSNH
jgi:hypothetical protein